MNYSQILHQSWNHSWQSIRRHKLLFAGLVVLQFIVLGLFVYIVLIHQLKVITAVQGVLEPLQQANYDADLVNAGQPFLPNTAAVYESYHKLMNAFYSFVLYSALLFLIPQSFLWAGSQILLQEKKTWQQQIRQIISSWCKYSAIFLVLTTPKVVITYLLGQRSFLLTDPTTALLYGKILLIVAVISYYILTVAFALTTIGSWRLWGGVAEKTLVRKTHYALPLFLVNTGIISMVIYTIYLTLNQTPLFAATFLLSIILLPLIVVLRIHWISFIQQIQQHE